MGLAYAQAPHFYCNASFLLCSLEELVNFVI